MFRSALFILAFLICAPLICAPALAAGPALLRPALVLLPNERRALVLGAWRGGRWLPAAATAPGLRAGELYRVRGLGGGAAAARGGEATSPGVPCETSFDLALRPLTPRPVFRTVTQAARNAHPRPVTALSTRNGTYRRVVREELVRRGLSASDGRLLGVTRADLNGDGTDEVILEAAHYAGRPGLFPPPVGQPGDYSLLLLRHVQNGEVRTTVLGAHLAPRTPYDPGSGAPMPLATLFRLAGLVDLNGDGRLEILTFGGYYEGFTVTASEWTPQGGLTTRLQTGCGA